MNDLESLKAELDATRRRLDEIEAQRRPSPRWAIVAATLVLVALPAWSQLSTFSPNQPAVASQINANFQQLKTWLEQKVGPVGSASVTLAAPVAGSGFISGTNLAPGSVTAAALGNGVVSNANLSADLSCPDATARGLYGACIFYLPSSGTAYVYNYTQAANACRTQGARLCSNADLSAAQAAGLERCSYGWLADRTDNSTAYRSFPMQNVVSGCGAIGINGGAVAMSTVVGAWCCK